MYSPLSPGTPFEFPDVGSKWKERNDRQLRLWGIHGQERIDHANVCLLNASAVGCEVLKNIVLPGFGQFTVVDNKSVTERDLGLNFFVTRQSIGDLRAKVVMENLLELNPDNVHGSFLAEDPVAIIEQRPDFFQSFNFVIASQMNTETVRKLAKICWGRNIVLIVVRSYGFIGYIRVAMQRHEVSESKLDAEQEDLRIAQPWDKLLEFVNSLDLDAMGPGEFKHTPYIVILIKALQVWRSKHDGKLPSTRAEKEEFTKQVQGMARDPSDENVEEAVRKIYQAWTEPEIPHEVQRIFAHDMCKDEALAEPDTNDFWFMARAVKEFTEQNGGVLPLQGRVPDMVSDTERYVALQTIYRRKARADMEAVKQILVNLLEKHGRQTDSITDVDIKEFCKNSLYMRVIEYRSMEQELDATTANKQEIQNHMYDPTDNTIFYLLFRAADAFFAQHGYYPGERRPSPADSSDAMKDDDSESPNDESLLSEEQYESDSKELRRHLDVLLNDLGIVDHGFESLDDYCKEVTRWGNNELHGISSLVGGVAAQEMIKICTRQRLPLNNTWIYNGINSTSTSIEL